METTRYTRSGPLRIAYELRGALRSRRPWVVLIQGLGFDHSGWDPVVEQMQRHFRLVLVDNRGSGRSDVPTDSFTIADMARDVITVLDSAGIRTAHVIGASLGGMVAQELAIEYPHRVRRLVLACTTPGWPFAYPMPAPSVRLIAQARSLPYEVALRSHVENALSAATVEHRPELVDRIVAHQLSRQVDPDTWAAQAAAGAHYFGHLRQARIRAETLVVHGDADTVVDPHNATLLAARIPQAQLLMLPDLGHLFFWEDPDGFVRAVVPFLRAKTGKEEAVGTAVTLDRAARPVELERVARAAPLERPARPPNSRRATRPPTGERAARLARVRRALRTARYGLTRVLKG